MKGYSVIIASYNEADNIQKCILSLQSLKAGLEIILVDGGSNDGTRDIARRENIPVYLAPRGRGSQFNLGISKAQGDILIFLHADTCISLDAFKQIKEAFKNKICKAARFRCRFDRKHWILNFYAYFTRFDSLFTSFGDQVIVVSKNLCREIGGFDDWLLFEDVHFFQKLRKKTKICVLPGPVTTSARKFLMNGIIRQQLRNGWFMLLYLIGFPVEKLARKY